jgi:hypothetical protein
MQRKYRTTYHCLSAQAERWIEIVLGAQTIHCSGNNDGLFNDWYFTIKIVVTVLRLKPIILCICFNHATSNVFVDARFKTRGKYTFE